LFTVPFKIDATKFASDLAKITGSASKAAKSMSDGAAKSFGSFANQATKSFGLVLRESSKTFNAIARDSSKTKSMVARDMAAIASSMQKMRSSGGGSKGGSIGGGSGILSWIGPGVGIGIGQKLLDGVMSSVSMPGKILGQWLTDSMDLTVVNRKFDIVFGSLRGQAQKFSKDFTDEVNGSLTNTKAMMARFQDTFVPLGFDRSKSFEMSSTTTRLAYDLAASEGMSTTEAAERLQSAIIGNHEAVRIFGVGLSDVTLKQELLRMGITKHIDSVSQQEKSLARLNFIVRSTADAHGAAARAQGDLRQQLGGLSAVFTEVSARMGMVFAPAAAKIVQFIKEIGVEINKALGPSERWGKTLGEGIGEFLKNAEPIKKFFKEMMVVVTNFISTMATGFKTLGGMWGDRGAFFAQIKAMFSQIGTFIDPVLIRIEEQIGKMFAGLAGGIMGVFGTATESIKVMIIAFIDSLYATITEVSKQIHDLTSMIPGTKAYELERSISSAKGERNAIKAPSKFFEFDSAGNVTNNLTDKEAAAVDEYYKKKEDADKKVNDLIARRAVTPTALKEVSQSLSSMGALDPIAATERFFSGMQAGRDAFGQSILGKGISSRMASADGSLASLIGANPTDVKDPSKGLLGSITSELGRLATNVQSIFAEAKIKPIALAPKSEMEKAMEKDIETEKKRLKKLKGGGQDVEFTSSDDLWKKVQSALNPKDDAIKKQEEQIKIMQKQLEEAKETKAKIGQFGVTVGESIGKFLGYGQ
jgi:hypothetical protein